MSLQTSVIAYPKFETRDGDGEIQVDIWVLSLGFSIALFMLLLIASVWGKLIADFNLKSSKK